MQNIFPMSKSYMTLWQKNLSFLGVVPFVRDRESKSFQSILRLQLDKDLHSSHLMHFFGRPYARLIFNNMDRQRIFLAWNVTENRDFSREFI
jgi:hypothetical protein